MKTRRWIEVVNPRPAYYHSDHGQAQRPLRFPRAQRGPAGTAPDARSLERHRRARGDHDRLRDLPVAGRDRRQAELAARFDALLQMPDRQAQLLGTVVGQLAQAQAERRDGRWADAAATRVEFLTMVRGT